jgi:crotonobetainyl-CoA:carnitine CoA-transferase CaiB-like acyl-CoA transferase
MADLPLLGVKVLDFSRVLAGPLSAMVLGDLGADVLKIEHPLRGDDTRDWGLPIAPGDTTYFYSFNRNKRSATFDLASAEGQAAVKRLVKEADVVVENFKAGGMEQFGLGYEALRAINPKLIYCAISGYDRAGPEAARPGYDLVVQGESGLMSINGEADRPPLKLGIAAVDLFTGMYAAQGILAALFQAERTGQGKRIDLALYDCGVVLSSYYGLEALLMDKDPPRVGNAHPSIVPYGVFEAADGPLVIAVGNNEQFRNFCTDVLGRPDLADDERYDTNLKRARNREALLSVLDAELATHKRADLLQSLTRNRIPCGEVLGLHEALVSNRTADAGIIGTHDRPGAGQVHVMSPPWRFDGERLPVRRPPMLGEHNDEVAAELAKISGEAL